MNGCPPPTVTLAPMTAAELEAFIGEEVADCARARLRDGACSRHLSLALAQQDMAQVICWQRASATDAYRQLWAVHREDGLTVGWLWVKLPPPGLWTGCAFLCQMTVAREHRRHGYGRAMLAALEGQLAAQGITELRLNVWEQNTPAKALYTSAGYEVCQRHETIRQLRKALGSLPAASVAQQPAA